MLAIVDAGPLYAAADTDDEDHAASVRALARRDLELIAPALVVAEATYFVGRRLGAAAEAAALSSSIVRPSLRRCSKASCSGTKRVRLQEQLPKRWAVLNSRTRGRYF